MVSGAVGDAATKAALTYAEGKIKEYTGQEIEVVTKDVPDNRLEWVRKTGVNSLCTDDTWSFLEKSEYNMRKVELWKERNIKKIVLTVNEKPDKNEIPDWAAAVVDWKHGSDVMTIVFLPYAFTWSSDNYYWESGYRCWWILSDYIVFGLQLYQLPGKCFYKSDWLDGFVDVDPDGLLPSSTKKFRRWFQFRHWTIFWYAADSWGWNYQWTETPPKNEDGSEFKLENVLKLPGMPSLSMPSLRLPSLPGMPSLSMPSMPSLSMPSLSAPSLSMPSLSAPSLPSLPAKKKRPEGKWDSHGVIELNGMKAKASGKKLILSNVTLTNFWVDKNGNYENETKEHQRLELECTNAEQALSWVLSLKEVGVEEGEVGGCCSVA